MTDTADYDAPMVDAIAKAIYEYLTGYLCAETDPPVPTVRDIESVVRYGIEHVTSPGSSEHS